MAKSLGFPFLFLFTLDEGILFLSVDDLCVGLRGAHPFRGLTKVEVGAVVWLEELSVSFGMNVCSFTDQQLHIANTPPLYGYMQSGLACKSHTSLHMRETAMLLYTQTHRTLLKLILHHAACTFVVVTGVGQVHKFFDVTQLLRNVD